MHSLKPLKYMFFVRGAPLRGTFFPMFALNYCMFLSKAWHFLERFDALRFVMLWQPGFQWHLRMTFALI